METENQESQNQTSEETETKEQPKAKEEPSVTKQIEKMRKRIDKEVGQKHDVEDKLAASQKEGITPTLVGNTNNLCC